MAASLQKSGFRSAHQYIAELRLLQIEEGLEIPSWLARLFFQVRKSLLRGLGPPDKAPELRFEDCSPCAEELTADCDVALADPWSAFVVATRFLLREIELAGLKLAHVSFSGSPSTAGEEQFVATCWLPVSK